MSFAGYKQGPCHKECLSSFYTWPLKKEEEEQEERKSRNEQKGGGHVGKEERA